MLRRTLLSNWHFMRWLRLAIGVFFIMQFMQDRSSFSILLATLFLSQALFNMGCGAQSCGTGYNRRTNIKEIDYQEIK